MADRIEKRLWAMQDEAYRRFQAGLLPGVAPERIIGVRTPLLRRLAKELAGTEAAEAFLSDLPHAYYDENNLHGLILNEGRSYAETMERVNRFLPFVDNWATCDLLRPKAFCRNRAALREEIDGWLAAKEPFTVRFGIEMLLVHFLGEDFEPGCLEQVTAVRREEYYVRMMVAWYFATALAEQWDAAVPVIETERIDPWTHNKAIQKAVESARITPEQKAFLRGYRRNLTGKEEEA